jgi:hypothetical protein
MGRNEEPQVAPVPVTDLVQTPKTDIKAMINSVYAMPSDATERTALIGQIREENNKYREQWKLPDTAETHAERVLRLSLSQSSLRSDWSDRGEKSTEAYIAKEQKQVGFIKELGLSEEMQKNYNEALISRLLDRGSWLHTSEGVQRFFREAKAIGIDEKYVNSAVDLQLAHAVVFPTEQTFSTRLEGDVKPDGPETYTGHTLTHIEEIATNLGVTPDELKNRVFGVLEDVINNGTDDEDVATALGLNGSDRVQRQVLYSRALELARTQLNIDGQKVEPLSDKIAQRFLKAANNVSVSTNLSGVAKDKLTSLTGSFDRLPDGVREKYGTQFTESVKHLTEVIEAEAERKRKYEENLAERVANAQKAYEGAGAKFTEAQNIDFRAEGFDEKAEASLRNSFSGEHWEQRDQMPITEMAILKPGSYEEFRKMMCAETTESGNLQNDNLTREGDGFTKVGVMEGFELFALRPDGVKEVMKFTGLGQLQTRNREMVLTTPKYEGVSRAEFKVKPETFWESKPVFILVRRPDYPRN